MLPSGVCEAESLLLDGGLLLRRPASFCRRQTSMQSPLQVGDEIRVAERTAGVGIAADHIGIREANPRQTRANPGTDGTLPAGICESLCFFGDRNVASCGAAGRPSGVSGKPTPTSASTLYTGSDAVQYEVNGAVKALTRGDGLTETWVYNPERLQPASISVGTSGTPRSVFGLDLYCCAGELSSCQANNGNILTLSIAPLGVDQNFVYDGVNRLTSAQETSSWSRTYGYDQFGNRWVPSSVGLSNGSFMPTTPQHFDTQNRLQIQSPVYDVSGNQKQIGGLTMTWDAEGRMVSSVGGGTTAYVYDGDGRRVMKQGSSGTTTYVYDATGDLVGEYGSTAAAPCAPCYLTVDQLGSTRAITSGDGSVVERHDYLPFGEDLYQGIGLRTATLKYLQATDSDYLTNRFTGQQRDVELAGSGMPSGLDYFGARYFSAAQGRFTSPDPLMHPSQSPKGTLAFLSNPQHWNKYAYVINNPLIRVDPDGLADYLYIESNVAKSQGVGLTAGHANLVRYNSDTNTTTTYGLWPDSHPAIAAAGLSNGQGSDVRTNFAPDTPGSYPLKYGVELTSDQSAALDTAVAKRSDWGATNNCATWASSTFKTVTGVEVSSTDKVVLDTPRALGDSIKEKVATNPSAGVFPPGAAGAPGPAPKPVPPSSAVVTPKEPRRPFDDK
jgi:RHS repeat-associated protein